MRVPIEDVGVSVEAVRVLLSPIKVCRDHKSDVETIILLPGLDCSKD
jgi:hypothetical protein